MSTPVRWRRSEGPREPREDGDEREPALTEHDRRGIEAIRRRLDAEFADATTADAPVARSRRRRIRDRRSRGGGRAFALTIGFVVGCAVGSVGTGIYLMRPSFAGLGTRAARTPAAPVPAPAASVTERPPQSSPPMAPKSPAPSDSASEPAAPPMPGPPPAPTVAQPSSTAPDPASTVSQPAPGAPAAPRPPATETPPTPRVQSPRSSATAGSRPPIAERPQTVPEPRRPVAPALPPRTNRADNPPPLSSEIQSR